MAQRGTADGTERGRVGPGRERRPGEAGGASRGGAGGLDTGDAAGGTGRPGGGRLLPREHGAYAQLAFPLLTGLAYARFHPGALAFALAGVALFLAYEPVALLTGVRGDRLRTALAGPARRRLALLAAIVILAGVAALALAPRRAWLGAAAPAALAASLLPLYGRRGLKSVAGEGVLAAAFASAVIPLAWCGPGPGAPAVLAALVWLGAFVPAILAVHAVKANHRRKPERRWTLRATPIAGAAVVLAALAAAGTLPSWGMSALAALPPGIAALVLGLAPPHPRHLARVGWTMVAADTLALVLLLAL